MRSVLVALLTLGRKLSLRIILDTWQAHKLMQHQRARHLTKCALQPIFQVLAWVESTVQQWLWVPMDSGKTHQKG